MLFPIREHKLDKIVLCDTIVMNRFSTLGRCIFCYPAPLPSHEEDIEEDIFERNVRRFNEVFSWIDLINLILDCISHSD